MSKLPKNLTRELNCLSCKRKLYLPLSQRLKTRILQNQVMTVKTTKLSNQTFCFLFSASSKLHLFERRGNSKWGLFPQSKNLNNVLFWTDETKSTFDMKQSLVSIRSQAFNRRVTSTVSKVTNIYYIFYYSFIFEVLNIN